MDTLKVDRVTISFKQEGGDFTEYTYRPEDLEAGLDNIEAHLVDTSFLMEFEGGVLYTGGDGCFSLRALLTPAQMQQLTGGVLKSSGFDMYTQREVTGVALFDGRTVVYQ